ncbi:MAG: tRNA lysidine(34) synthetase TilS [Alphaproteobacteria bacterium]|nr:tRNA lysidine(34) synthetase TilS [Alphaproteobacteria bacterium]
MSAENPSRAAETALTPAEFAALMAPFEPDIAAASGRLAVACSGGPDSMALTACLHEWAALRGRKLDALIVDHGLRPDSGAEAERVRAWLADRGVSATCLSDPGGAAAAPLKSNIQDRARTLRYRLLQEWCARAGVRVLVVAHHRDDQAETVLLRLARGSGVSGLAAMRPKTRLLDPLFGPLTVIRPFLDTPKARVAASLARFGWPSAQDPSNADPRFARVRMRRAAPDLAQVGLTSETLAETAAVMARADDALRGAARTVIDRHVRLHPAGYARVAPGLWEASDDIALRALRSLAQAVGGAAYPPRSRSLIQILAAARDGLPKRGMTFAGVKIQTSGSAPGLDRTLLILRESAAIDHRIDLQSPAPNAPVVWDRRFVLGPIAGAGGEKTDVGTIRKLGQAGVAQARKLGYSKALAALPGSVRAGLPGLWRGDVLAAAPALRQDAGHGAEPMEAGGRSVYCRFAAWRQLLNLL